MNIRLVGVIFFLIVFGALELSAQGTGVKSEYLKDGNITKVETNMLYVGNTADQFVGIQLTGTYKGEKLESPPKIEITVFSFSKEPIYKKDKDRVVVIIANGAETNVGTLANTTFKGETKNGVDTYFAVGGDPNIGMQVPLPQGAVIRVRPSLEERPCRQGAEWRRRPVERSHATKPVTFASDVPIPSVGVVFHCAVARSPLPGTLLQGNAPGRVGRPRSSSAKKTRVATASGARK